MDVGAPSNFERMQSLYGGDLEALRRDVAGLRLRRRAGSSRRSASVYRRHGYLLDPARAIAWLALQDALRRRIPTRAGVFLATAHPGEVPRSRRTGDRARPCRCRRRWPTAHQRGRATVERRCSRRLRATLRALAARRVADDACHTRHLPPRARQSCRPRRRFPTRYTWDLPSICASWDEWSASYATLDAAIDAFRAFQGTLGQGPEALLGGVPGDGRDGRAQLPGLVLRRRCSTTRISATTRSTRRRQQVQILFARQQQASSWFNPELLAIPLDTIRGWMDGERRRWRSTALRSRACSTSRSTCSTRRASGCCRIAGRFNSVPARQLLGADDGRHEVPVDHAGERRARSR